jgi:DNA-directed RNA polymerase specialized sigma24 family protein
MSLFPTTNWTLVGRAGGRDADARAALDALVRQYDRPLLVLITALARDSRVPTEVAPDILQTFLTERVVEKHLVATADQQRGRFRDLLRASMRNFFYDYLRRGSNKPKVVLADFDLVPRPSNSAPKNDSFDNAWAVEVLRVAITRYHAGCDADDRADLWDVFLSRVLRPILDGEDLASYDRLATSLGLSSADRAHNLLVTAKRRFAACLGDVVGQYALGASNVDEELCDLRRILQRSKRIVSDLSLLLFGEMGSRPQDARLASEDGTT